MGAGHDGLDAVQGQLPQQHGSDLGQQGVQGRAGFKQQWRSTELHRTVEPGWGLAVADGSGAGSE